MATRVEGWSYTFPAAPAEAIPAQVFATDHKLYLNDTDIVHVGDTWWKGVFPFIDYSTGGSIDGSIRAADINIAAVTDKTIVVRDTVPVGRKSDLVEFRDMLAAIRENVAALKKQGRSSVETVAAKPTAVYDAKWGRFLTTPEAFTRLVYAGV